MSTDVLDPPIRRSAGTHGRPALATLTRVELRKLVDTRTGFWLQVAIVALTAAAVLARLLVGDATQHTFVTLLYWGRLPAAVLLPVAGVLLITSEWSQRTGMITFALVPRRSRVIWAKLLASGVMTIAMLLLVVAIVAAGAAVAGVDGTWAHVVPLLGQSAVYLVGGVLAGVGFAMVALSTTRAMVALFVLPTAWAALASLPVFAAVAQWLDTNRSLDPLTRELLSATQWARVGTSLLVWMLVPLLLGAWRIARSEVAS